MEFCLQTQPCEDDALGQAMCQVRRCAGSDDMSGRSGGVAMSELSKLQQAKRRCRIANTPCISIMVVAERSGRPLDFSLLVQNSHPRMT